jgi:hypothetical protein
MSSGLFCARCRCDAPEDDRAVQFLNELSACWEPDDVEWTCGGCITVGEATTPEYGYEPRSVASRLVFRLVPRETRQAEKRRREKQDFKREKREARRVTSKQGDQDGTARSPRQAD